MEILRFGSSIPGAYWGCCCGDIIQNYNVDPDEPYSIELVSGDGGNPLLNGHDETLFLGKTAKEVFEARLRIGTFSLREMPNHFFLTVLTDYQTRSYPGRKWLKILEDNGFEFIRAVDNSVSTGAGVLKEPGKGTVSPHKNYVFGLFRNIGAGALENPFEPPAGWEGKTTTPLDLMSKDDQIALARKTQAVQLDDWKAVGRPTFYTEAELDKAKVPITYAGIRSSNPQELRETRRRREDNQRRLEEGKKSAVVSTAPFKVTGIDVV